MSVKVHRDPCRSPVTMEDRGLGVFLCPVHGRIRWWDVTHVDESKLFAVGKTRAQQQKLEIDRDD